MDQQQGSPASYAASPRSSLGGFLLDVRTDGSCVNQQLQLKYPSGLFDFRDQRLGQIWLAKALTRI